MFEAMCIYFPIVTREYEPACAYYRDALQADWSERLGYFLANHRLVHLVLAGREDDEDEDEDSAWTCHAMPCHYAFSSSSSFPACCSCVNYKV